MGFFSDGKGNSRAQTSSNTSNEQTTTNDVDNRVFNVGNGGVVVEGENASITTTDHGAIAAAERLGISAFELGSDAFTAVDRSSGRVLDAAELSIDRQSELTTDVLTFGGGVLERASEFARGIFIDAFEQSTNVLKEGQAQLGNTFTNLNAIARQQSTSDSERVQDIAQKALIAAAALAGLVVLAGAWKARAS